MLKIEYDKSWKRYHHLLKTITTEKKIINSGSRVDVTSAQKCQQKHYYCGFKVTATPNTFFFLSFVKMQLVKVETSLLQVETLSPWAEITLTGGNMLSVAKNCHLSRNKHLLCGLTHLFHRKTWHHHRRERYLVGKIFIWMVWLLWESLSFLQAEIQLHKQPYAEHFCFIMFLSWC